MNLNTIKTLESVPRHQAFSKYGESLDRVFRSKSLKNLIDSLKNPKKFVCKDFLTTEETPKHEKLTDESCDIFSDEQITEPKTINNNESKIIRKIRPSRLRYKNETLDPGKYNPNYNAISKNIPSFKIILPPKEKQKYLKQKENIIYHTEKYKLNKKLGKKIILKPIENNKHSFMTSLNTQISNDNKKKEPLNYSERIRNKSTNHLPPIINNIEQKENNEIIKNNHALRFSKYIPRKFYVENNVSDKVTYLKPYNYNLQNNVVDFKKMLSRREKDLINIASLEIPSFNLYNPKFDLVEKNQANCYFSYDKNYKNDKNNKKYLVKKFWSSYDEVSADYKLINGNKLEETDNILQYL